MTRTPNLPSSFLRQTLGRQSGCAQPNYSLNVHHTERLRAQWQNWCAGMSMRKNSASGFTLIEAMVAVTILTLSIAGPLYTANSAIVASMIARDQLTASYLAQEGIEYVRAMRDYEYLAAYHLGGGSVSADAWNNFLTGIEANCLSPLLSCTLDPVLRSMGYGSGFSVEVFSGDAPLFLTLSNIYTQQNLSESVKTPFTRTIQVVHISAADERIISTVSWSYHSVQHFVTVYDHLTPWQ